MLTPSEGIPRADAGRSADGRRLAAALGGANGIRVYGTTAQGAWAQVAADGAYGVTSYSVEFDAAGRLPQRHRQAGPVAVRASRWPALDAMDT